MGDDYLKYISRKLLVEDVLWLDVQISNSFFILAWDAKGILQLLVKRQLSIKYSFISVIFCSICG